MKVCLLNDSFPPVLDGVANVVMNYAGYLTSDYASEVVVGTPAYPNADYSSYPYRVIPYQSFDTEKLASGYRAGNPFAWKDLGALAEFCPDIIHTHCPASATIVSRLLRHRHDAPVVLTYHTKYDIDIARWFKGGSFLTNESIKAMVSNIEACDEVWAVSRGAGESLKALGFQGDVLVMDNGVDFARGRVDAGKVAEVTAGYDLPAGVPMYLFVGRLMTYKGLPLILDALKRVQDAGRDFRMVFIGKGPDRELLENRVRELDLEKKCIFVGPVYDREALRAWNTRADLFLFPSTFDTNGLVVREAAACGLASVLIDGSCAAEGITDGRNGYIISESAEAMAALLLQLDADLPAMHQVGEYAMQEIYLSWKDCVGKAYQRYQVLLEEKAAGRLEPQRHPTTEKLLEAVSRQMDERERFSRFRRELFQDFRETASGMMDNVQEAEDNLSAWKALMKDNMRQELSEIREKAGQFGEGLRQGLKKQP